MNDGFYDRHWRWFVLATLFLARRLHGAPALPPLAASFGRALGIAVPAGAAAYLVAVDRPGPLGGLIDLALGGAAFAVVATVGIALLGDAPLRDALARPVRALLRRTGRA